jgi:hypothetical protein
MEKEKKPAGEIYKNPAWKIAIGLVLFAVFLYFWGEMVKKEDVARRFNVTYTQFKTELEAGNIKSVTMKIQVDGGS